MPAVEVSDVRKAYGSIVALEDFSFVLERGEVLGVLGPNGAGKTTAIRIMTTILGPDRGSFSVAGIPHTRPSEIRGRIGVLPESAGYPERQTGEEYLRYHARLYGHPRASARALAGDLLGEVGLGDRGGSLISTYSRGMRQRLGLARTLVNDPEVVFLDEPTLGLDPAGQQQVLAHVRSIAAERGAAILLSSHLLAEVEENCTQVLILNKGRLVAHGTVQEIIDKAAAPRSGRIRVRLDHAARAESALARCPAVQSVQPAGDVSGRMRVVFSSDGHAADDASLGAVVQALVDAGVDLRSFELEGARLSDAFLAMTESA